MDRLYAPDHSHDCFFYALTGAIRVTYRLNYKMNIRRIGFHYSINDIIINFHKRPLNLGFQSSSTIDLGKI